MTTPAAKTSTERVTALRQRRAEQGLTEVRGVFLPPDLHPKIKAVAAKLVKPSKKPA